MLAKILDRIGIVRVLLKLDLVSGFHQVEMSTKSVEMTSFVCPEGKFMFRRIYFGLIIAPAVFQSIVEEVQKPAINSRRGAKACKLLCYQLHL